MASKRHLSLVPDQALRPSSSLLRARLRPVLAVFFLVAAIALGVALVKDHPNWAWVVAILWLACVADLLKRSHL